MLRGRFEDAALASLDRKELFMMNASHSYPGITLIAACLSLSGAGCAASTPAPPLTSATSTTASEVPGPALRGEPLPVTHPTTKSSEIVPATLTDGQIVAIASQMNQAAIAAANVALAHGKSDEVRQFALVVRSGRGAADTKLLQAARAHDITLTDSVTGNHLHGADDAQKVALMDRSGSDLDRAYVDAQVHESEGAIELLDTQLIPSATSMDVRAALEATRANVLSHLHSAQKIQVSLGAM